MEVNPLLQKVIAIYHITQFIAIVICKAVSITNLLVYILLSWMVTPQSIHRSRLMKDHQNCDCATENTRLALAFSYWRVNCERDFKIFSKRYFKENKDIRFEFVHWLNCIKMKTNISLRNDRFRAEMEVSPLLQKVITIYHITQVVAIIICVAVSITSLLFYILLSVHYNPILSTMWFLSVFPVFVCACILNGNVVIYSYFYGDTLDDRVTIVAVMTGILSLGSAIFAVMGIWKSARKVVLILRSGECDPLNAVGSVAPSYDAPVTFTDLNGIRIAQASYGKPMLPG